MKTRILHVFVTLPVGGAENLLLSILRELDPAKFESVVCTLGREGELAELVRSQGVPLIELNMMQKRLPTRAIVAALAGIMQQEGIALVHSHLYHANRYARVAARRVGIPAVVSIHNTYSHPKWHRRLINWWLARFTGAILVGSEEIRRDVLRYDRVPAYLVKTIPNSVDLERSLPARSQESIRSELSLPPGAFVLGTVGRLEIQKGHRLLIEAIAQLRKRFPVVLLLVGSGREEAALRDQIAFLGLEAEVRLLGTRRDLGDLFSVMDLFVMPSLWEGLSLAMLSAMAAGLPVVATDVGGVREVLGANERGWVIPPSSVEALVETVACCHDHPDEAAARAAAGRQHVHGHYSDRAMVQRIEGVYQELLSRAA